jgi:hypothetical protein
MSTEEKMNRAHRAQEKIKEKIDELNAKEKEIYDEMYSLKEKARQEYAKGNLEQAKRYMQMYKIKEKTRSLIYNQIILALNSEMRLNKKIHKLFISSVPEEFRKGVQNLDSTINLNNNSIERSYLIENTNNTNNIRTNTICNKLGRCFSRFTKKNNKKTKGGKRKTYKH